MRSGEFQKTIVVGEWVGQVDSKDRERGGVKALGEAFRGRGEVGNGVGLKDGVELGGGAGPEAVFVEQGGDGADEGVGGEGGVYVGGGQAEGGGGGGDPVVDVGGTRRRGGAGFGRGGQGRGGAGSKTTQKHW